MHFDLEDSRVIDMMGQKLRRLRSDGAPPMPWQEFKRRQHLKRARVQAEQRRQFALVAGVTIIMIGAFVSWRYLSPSVNSAAGVFLATTAPPPRRAAPTAWDEAAARSVVSERWLASQPAEPVIVHVGTRAAVTGLEDRIAWVDDTLTSMRAQGGQVERVHFLQHQRDQLVNSLAQVRYAETLVSDVP
jgi:hypothetical protein